MPLALTGWHISGFGEHMAWSHAIHQVPKLARRCDQRLALFVIA
jgi:hypothetical protein